MVRIWVFSLLGVALGSSFISLPADARARERRPDRGVQVAGLKPEDQRIWDALAVLERTSEGRHLLESARAFWRVTDDLKLLGRALRSGSVSRTDAVLTRSYDNVTGEETREREVTIYLQTQQPLASLVMDLAHELVHATTRPSWDPYDPDLTAIQYIRAAIDGPGGEVEAVASECRVALELSGVYGADGKSGAHRCQAYRRESPRLASRVEVDRDRIADDFYRVGRWHSALEKGLGKELIKLSRVSREDPRLISSTGEAPYPIALFWEYQEMTRSACRNSRIRALAESRSSQAADRAPASLSEASRKPSAQSTEELLSRRCSEIPR